MFKANAVFTSDLPDETREAIRYMIGQLPIVWALREGGEVRVPVAEVDGTGPYMLNIEIEGTDFVFRTTKKS